MAVVFGLLAAVGYGSGDFLGGLASKRAATQTVVVGSQLVGLLLGVVMALFIAAPRLDRGDLVYGAIGGCIGLVGVTALYRGLAVGRMSVVAPITAVGSALVPVAWGLASGERPSPVALVGVVCALPAVALVSRVPSDADSTLVSARGEVLLASGAGLCFGVALVLFSEAADGTGLWPLVASRAVSVTLLASGALIARRLPRPSRAAVPVIVATGVLDITANAFYFFGVGTGLVSLVAVLASLYPAGTVALARVVLDERLSRHQLAGMGLAVGGAALIALGR
jgi:drug/metabolite transporter (DMT)-like permease